jgi:hypothetical protein
MRGPRLRAVATTLTAALAAAGAPACTEARTNARGCADVPLALDRAMIVLESDRASTSAIGRIDLEGCLEETADVALGGDPSLSLSRGRPFISVRDQGIVLELHPETGAIARSIAVFQAGEPQPNPWDVAVDAAGRIWVARYNLASAAVIEPDGSWAGSVDLGPLSDDDGIPEMGAAAAFGDRVFIALERLQPNGEGGFSPAGPGAIAVASTEPPFALSEPIELTGKNPFGRLVPSLADPTGSSVTSATPGDFDAIDEGSGVELIHLDTGEHHVVVSEAALGGSVTEAIIAGPSEGYAIVAGPEHGTNPTSVVRFDPTSGEVTRKLAGPAGAFVHTGLTVNGPYVVVGDRTYGAPGIHFFDRETGERAASLTPQVLAPVSIIALDP